jgi:type I restriction enzyme M protein
MDASQYATPLPQLVEEVEALSARVGRHLQKMGFA